MSTVISVSGGGFRPYAVLIGRDLMTDLGGRVAALAQGRTVIVTDETVAALHGPAVLAALEGAGVRARLLTVPPGEASKSFAELERVIDRLLAFGLDRRDLIVALGGGVVGDLAGLAAALFMRGIDFVQVPTTLLAQVDSSVGGKTAIDTPRGKNLVGAFHQPRLVVADIDLLATLPERQLRSGWAEVLKHGLICDAAFFEWLAGEGAVGAAGDPAALTRAVVRSVEIKSVIVGEDEKEAGRRALLNLGHTFGHAIEAELGFDETRITHGEAVALGCALAFRFSAFTGVCSVATAEQVAQVLAAAGLPTRLEAVGVFSTAALLKRMAGDKKAEGGRLTLILARAIGEAFVDKAVDRAVLAAFLTGEGAT
ncbi:MAG: 3-dehydroquinate synthase [Brevundimonas sp.]|uniref:3-dehydroquinate synthase n=1 Tax=Brevundimonas sp. TaxID=1871086 RepID=UPI00272015A2|nr:3-dehydroquinate synthase [Brevundimonas sp.]MDO9589462.1 3-dehydroquinate synthase [Brevundimonas sp.]MDP3369002.1 3-dehydroquinate synthase [Brevundimonas sp.]MDP3657533.1 3-dehydroquinate synthase [Brevundimonas sp.]MDZ4110503.1 3-dehydroquinate synthase [Brevundimonas sp.]